ncbi:histone-like nucleoid-structuring protein Lsr2 [Microbacterium luticocti]|uniref:histone-like nucleoid-structuring protein Lsr2 n=1 Tax=Microbacterium luticocti TaxID=451764 RepID=UPI00048DE9B2|nr:Lsr2 family protein [Microbacterium luticocti]
MAQKIIHQLVDDLDGTVLEPGAGQTVLFSLDGISYEVDLTDENAQKLRDAFAPYVSVARSVSVARTRRGAGSTRGNAGRRRTGQRDYGPIREWAAQNGYSISDRGRIPAAVLEAYDAAH